MELVNLQHPTISPFALTKGLRSKRQLSKSFTVVIQPISTCLIKPKIYMKPTVVPRVFHLPMKVPGNKFDRTPCDLGLDTKIPKNHLQIYLKNPSKSSINLHFLATNLINLSENVKKFHDFVDEYFAENTLLSVQS